MLIVCPNCSTSYEVKAETIGDAGRTVRCTRCREEWFAAAPAPQTAMLATAGATPPPSAAIDDFAAADPDDQVDWETPAHPDDKNLAGDAFADMLDIPQAPSPPLAPDADADTIEADPAPASAKTATPASPRERRIRLRRPDRVALPLAPTLIAVQLAVLCAGLLWRNEIVHVMPQTASFFRAIGLGVNLRGLAFTDVRTTWDSHDGATVLIIEGAVVNTTRAAIAVPRLRFALRNAAAAELSSWTAPPEKSSLAPGEMLPFRSHLASPPAGGSDILVRFLNRQDFLRQDFPRQESAHQESAHQESMHQESPHHDLAKGAH